MKIFDTQAQKLKKFVPVEGNRVKMYVCGPTVYDSPHLGHARCYITWDMVYRYLKFRGYDVTYVRNITDVDDKIIQKAAETGVTPQEIAEKYYAEFEIAMRELNVLKPDIEPKATENIPEMIDMIDCLVKKGFAYPVKGDVYFDVGKFNRYGRLSRQNIDELKAGARVETSKDKHNAMDFALWKAVKTDGEPGWDSPWGKGRPGWHIECSAMVKKYLGETIDIHAGGQDLVFPHHENEKAQSEAAFGGEFVKNWMHNGFVRINEEKMSKSTGNFVTIRDVLNKYDSNTIRFFILTNQYRMPVEFNDEALIAAKNGVKRLKNAYQETLKEIGEDKMAKADRILSLLIDEIMNTDQIPFHEIDKTLELEEEEIPSEIIAKCIAGFKRFMTAMDDDFNTPQALSVLFEMATSANTLRQSDSPDLCAYCAALLLKTSNVLGFDLKKEEEISEEMVSQLMNIIISFRQTAREEKNWPMSDKIRDELAKIGITLRDYRDKPTSWEFSEQND